MSVVLDVEHSTTRRNARPVSDSPHRVAADFLGIDAEVQVRRVDTPPAP